MKYKIHINERFLKLQKISNINNFIHNKMPKVLYSFLQSIHRKWVGHIENEKSMHDDKNRKSDESIDKVLSQQTQESRNIMTFQEKLEHDLFERPHYAYGVYHAALQARELGIKKISVIEFGVADGKGLIALENVAIEIEKKIGIDINVYGFDTGQGMPESLDYRDLPYVWKKGFFPYGFRVFKITFKKSDVDSW